MDFYELKAFLTLSRQLHFAKASAALNMSPSALSRLISRLEEETGVKLLDRDTRQVSLTKEGEEFALFAGKCLEEKKALEDSLVKTEGFLQGTLNVYASVTACYTILPDFIASLSKKHPYIKISVETGDPAGATEALKEGRAQLAVTAIPSKSTQSIDSGISGIDRLVELESVSVKKSPLVLVSSPNKFQNKKYTTPEETISSLPLILPKAGLARKRFDYWCKNRNISPNILAETAGNEAIIALARLGLGLGLVPKIVLENGPFSEGVVQYSTFSQLEEYNIGFIFNPKPSGTEGAKKLQKAIIQILKDNYS